MPNDLLQPAKLAIRFTGSKKYYQGVAGAVGNGDVQMLAPAFACALATQYESIFVDLDYEGR